MPPSGRMRPCDSVKGEKVRLRSRDAEGLDDRVAVEGHHARSILDDDVHAQVDSEAPQGPCNHWDAEEEAGCLTTQPLRPLVWPCPGELLARRPCHDEDKGVPREIGGKLLQRRRRPTE